MSVLWISLSADVPCENLDPPMASISSMKMMHGECVRANVNISRITLADCDAKSDKQGGEAKRGAKNGWSEGRLERSDSIITAYHYN